MSTDLLQLKAIAEAATPGPWRQKNKKIPYVWAIGTDEEQHGYLMHKMPIGDDAKGYHPDTRARWLADSAHIAAANPAVVLDLIQQITDLRAALSAQADAPSANKCIDIAKRLRLVCNKLGLATAIPEEDRTLYGCMFSVLGMVRRKIDESQAAAPVDERAANVLQIGWLVESGKQGDELRYRTWIDGMPAWTDDHNEATRYCRRIDAERAHQEDEDAWRIVEHAWYDVATSAPHDVVVPASSVKNARAELPTEAVRVFLRSPEGKQALEDGAAMVRADIDKLDKHRAVSADRLNVPMGAALAHPVAVDAPDARRWRMHLSMMAKDGIKVRSIGEIIDAVDAAIAAQDKNVS